MKETKQTTPMTFAELVDEAVEYYTNNPRSKAVDGECRYAGPNGERCAAARLCDESVTDLEHLDAQARPSWGDVHYLATLKPEYAHFTTEQIQALQGFHDRDSNWIDPYGKSGTRGLSPFGKKRVDQIKLSYV